MVMYCVGALVVLAPLAVSVVLAGAVAVLLHLKEPLHRFVGRMGEQDVRAIMQLVLIALVILPILPDRPFGPYQVLNPYQIWWMVVLIVGLSLAGYVAFKLFGANAGQRPVRGALGGLISSTATTVSYARRTKDAPESSRLAALVIMIASTVVFGRVLVEMAAVAPSYLIYMGPPIGAMLGVAVGGLPGRLAAGPGPQGRAAGAGESGRAQVAPWSSAPSTPGVLLAVAFARDRFGTAGLYTVAAISGLTDVDAITLSTSRLVAGGGVDPSTGWRAILLAGLSNLVFKAGIVAALGSRGLFGRIALLFGLALAGGGLILWLWP